MRSCFQLSMPANQGIESYAFYQSKEMTTGVKEASAVLLSRRTVNHRLTRLRKCYNNPTKYFKLSGHIKWQTNQARKILPEGKLSLKA